MKKISIIIIIFSLLVAGCTDRSNENQKQEEPDVKTFFSPDSKEKFFISYPDWDKTTSDDPFNNLTLAHEQCRFSLNVVDAPQEWYEKGVKDFILKNEGTILSESPLSYQLKSGQYSFETRTKALFCDDKTYFVFISCLDNRFDEKTAKDIFGSMKCTKEWKTPDRSNRKLGLVVSPQNTTDIKSYFRAYNLARDNNVQMTHYYASWIEDENDRANNDFIINTIRNKGLEVSIAFEIIHSSVKGKIPDDIEFRGWDDPDLISRFSDFVIEYIERYKDTVKYVEIGNEVDIYFKIHPDELRSYKIFYKEVEENIKKAHPDIKVGTVFAYHEMRNNNNFEVYRTLSPIGDFDAFTLYVYDPGFIFNRDPVEIQKYLQEIEKLTGDRKFALEEVGWNADNGLQGNENDQRLAVKYFFDYLEQAPERLEFMTWFILHDGNEKDCRTLAETFIEPGDPILNNDEFMSPFSDFICYLGLIRSDGTPRKGWNEFKERALEYRNS